ncbi:MAG: hypothetical protein KAI22_08100 [Gammaproteobacteria bacterium]|nr:hypothetical protein [Gammaproteobacteria bacterium]
MSYYFIKKLISGLLVLSSILVNSASAKEHLSAMIIGSGSPVHNENRASGVF